jgi:dUTP pyrophosphatase
MENSLNELNILDQDIKKILENANNLVKDWVYVDNVMKLKIRFVNQSTNQDPAYAKQGDSGFDLRAFLKEDAVLKPFQRALVPTGLYFQIPENFELQVRPRSGLALKNGITVLNTPGTVDSGYRGEICVILINLGSEDFIIKNGDRIAQAVIAPVQTNNNLVFMKSSSLESSERGDTGFGSSGVK